MITVQTTVNAPLEKAWKCWTEPQHITKWCQASDDWHAPYAENDVKVGGKFKTTMAAKDGSFSFDFEGEYTEVDSHKVIKYNMPNGRKVEITFEEEDGKTTIVESFDPESENPEEMQRNGWQSILDNFKKYTENN